MLNKYGNLSGGYIFTHLDNKSHELAESIIGECETITAEIKYFGHITEKDLDNFTIYTFDRLGNKNKIMIDTVTKGLVFARFIFVKL